MLKAVINACGLVEAINDKECRAVLCASAAGDKGAPKCSNLKILKSLKKNLKFKLNTQHYVIYPHLKLILTMSIKLLKYLSAVAKQQTHDQANQ